MRPAAGSCLRQADLLRPRGSNATTTPDFAWRPPENHSSFIGTADRRHQSRGADVAWLLQRICEVSRFGWGITGEHVEVIREAAGQRRAAAAGSCCLGWAIRSLAFGCAATCLRPHDPDATSTGGLEPRHVRLQGSRVRNRIRMFRSIQSLSVQLAWNNVFGHGRDINDRTAPRHGVTRSCPSKDAVALVPAGSLPMRTLHECLSGEGTNLE